MPRGEILPAQERECFQWVFAKRNRGADKDVEAAAPNRQCCRFSFRHARAIVLKSLLFSDG